MIVFVIALLRRYAEDRAILEEIERMDAALWGSSDRLDALADAYTRTLMDPLLKEVCEGFTVGPGHCGFPKDKAESGVTDTEENPEEARAA